MMIRLGDTNWVNLDNAREIKVEHVVKNGKETNEFCVAIETYDSCYYTDALPDKQTGINVARAIARELNEGDSH